MTESIEDLVARYPDPAPAYTTIAHLKAALVERTGLLGVASVWGGRRLVGRHFLGFGSGKQRAEWLGRALSVAISEPKVGAHPKLLTTRADRVDGGFRITGQKAWVSNGPSAEAIIVFAITAEEAGRKRYSAFIVPRGTPGLTIADMPDFHALRPSKHCLLTLDGCVVPDRAMLGEAGSAYDRMALPFRDIEDAVGTFGILGAFRYAIGSLAGTPLRQTGDLGAVVALTAVFAAGAGAVVASLDAGRFHAGDATLVGLRVLAMDIVSRLRGIAVMADEGSSSMAEVDGDATPDGSRGRLAEILADLDATLSIAQGPRLARQTRLGEAALHPGRPSA